MKIMVFDVPAESGGALSVLNDFYTEYKADQKNKYIFVISLPELKETSNLKVLKFPWIKKSWMHRLYFDHIVAPKLIRKHKIDRVLSLQNVNIPHSNIYQSVFVHNALPFSEYRFRFREDKLLWVYQNIIGRNIKKSVEKSDRVIVQTNWMKKKFVEQLNINAEKIEIKRPKVKIDVKDRFLETKVSLSTFFYPSSGVRFKNHKVIVDACLKLKEDGIEDYNVIFTLNGNENEYIEKLYEVVREKKLPIKFIGNINRGKVFEHYTKAILVFPSYIETVGLPLIEACMHNTPIIASHCDYSVEILNEYKYVSYFEPFSYIELSNLMIKYLSKSI